MRYQIKNYINIACTLYLILSGHSCVIQEYEMCTQEYEKLQCRRIKQARTLEPNSQDLHLGSPILDSIYSLCPNFLICKMRTVAIPVSQNFVKFKRFNSTKRSKHYLEHCKRECLLNWCYCDGIFWTYAYNQVTIMKPHKYKWPQIWRDSLHWLSADAETLTGCVYFSGVWRAHAQSEWIRNRIFSSPLTGPLHYVKSRLCSLSAYWMYHLNSALRDKSKNRMT